MEDRGISKLFPPRWVKGYKYPFTRNLAIGGSGALHRKYRSAQRYFWPSSELTVNGLQILASVLPRRYFRSEAR